MTEAMIPKQRVLILDASDRIRRDIRIFLETSRRYEVVGEASDFDEAVDLVRATRPDIVLVDIEMVEGDGLRVLRNLRACLPSTALVVAIQFDNDEYDAAARAAGAAASVPKKRLFESLLPTLEEARDAARRTEGNGDVKWFVPDIEADQGLRSIHRPSTPMALWWKPIGWREWLSGVAAFGSAVVRGAPMDEEPPNRWWRYIEAGMAGASLVVLISYVSGGFAQASALSKGLILTTLLVLVVAEVRQIRRLAAERPLELKECRRDDVSQVHLDIKK